jgi:ATP-binding cassette subfamily C protein CydD
MPDLPYSRFGHPEQLGSVLAVVSSLIWLGQASVIASVLSSLLAGAFVNVWGVAAVFVLLGVVRAWVNKASQRLLASAAEAKIQSLRQEIIEQEARTNSSSILGGPGAISALSTQKLEALRPYLLRYKPARMRVMVVPLVILAVTVWHSWAAAVVLLVAGPLIPVFMALVGIAAKEASAKQMVEIGAMNDLLADRLAALSDLRLIGAGDEVVSGFARASDDLRLRTMAVLRIAFLSSTVLELFAALGVAMIAVWVGFALLGALAWGSWGIPLTPFAGILLLLVAPDFFQPLRDLAVAWHDKSAADAVMDEVKAWRQDERPEFLGSGMIADPIVFQGLTTKGLIVRRGDRQISYPDLTIQTGDAWALTGPSGAGKSTLLRVLAGLDLPKEGSVQLGEDALSDKVADRWRAAVGWMPQSPRFLGQSVVHNIGFGAPVSEKILLSARVSSILSSLPAGGDTVLGETGAGLSGGEARRVMLARALHRAPQLLLVDEPTADLDAETAQGIIDALLAYVASGGTLVAATHDPRLIAQMSQEIRLEAQA